MKRKLLVSTISSALAFWALSGAALAQDTGSTQDPNAPATEEETEANLQRVVVTGSLIPQAQQETASPVTTITAEQIEQQGYRNVSDVLRAQPLATGSVQDNQFSQGFTPGATTISLLGLDPGFTLILLDGRPLADYPLLYNGQSNFTDLSTIPTAMVERIDILPGNQSAIYGSAAIAGVVNIILKKHLEGMQLNVRMGGYDAGGGDNWRLQLTGGKQFGKLDLTYGFQYSTQDAMFGFQNPWYDSTDDNPNPNTRFGSRTAIIQDGFTGAYYEPTAEQCNRLGSVFGGTTQLDYRPDPDGFGRWGIFCGSRAEVGNTSFLNDEDSLSGYLNATWTLTDNVEAYASLLVNHHETTASSFSRFWIPDVNGEFGSVGGYVWDYDGVCDIVNFGCPLNLYQRILGPEETGGPSKQVLTSKSYNFAGGVRGTFGDSNWDYDAYYARSQFNITDSQMWPLTDEIEEFFRDQFLGPLLGTAYGYPVYHPDNDAFYQPLTPDQYASFLDEIRTESTTWTHTVNLSITNASLFELPAGDVGMAALVQAGHQVWNNPTDQRVIDGEFWGITGTQGSGKRDSVAAAVEFRVPIFSTLTANLSGRYDKYKNIGAGDDAKATWKLGLEYRPVETLLIRGNYATAFRAPDMSYIYAGDSGFFGSGVDYYRCEEAGQPVATCDYNDEQIQGRRIGNPDLASITAKSFGYGFVWSPSKNFDLRADYYNIDISNEVIDLSTNFILRNENECRQGRQDINSAFCQDIIARVERNPVSNTPLSEAIQLVRTNPVNIATERVSGINSAMNFRWGGGRNGNFGLGLNYNNTLKHEVQRFPDEASIDYLTTPTFSSEFKSVVSGDFTWEVGRWDAAIHGVRYGSTPNYTAQTGQALSNGIPPGKVAPYMLFNLNLGYELTDNSRLALTVNNLGNRKPPSDPSWTAYPYYNIFNYNGYGRSWFVQYSVDFDAN
jgi:outer membrane receptor protein involved in Fe transport